MTMDSAIFLFLLKKELLQNFFNKNKISLNLLSALVYPLFHLFSSSSQIYQNLLFLHIYIYKYIYVCVCVCVFIHIDYTYAYKQDFKCIHIPIIE